MGLFDFFRRRRERESATPGESSESLTRQLKGDGKPIGQPVGQALPPTGQAFNLTGPADLTAILATFQQAFQSGNFQVTQGENQVIDLRGTGLRDEIIAPSSSTASTRTPPPGRRSTRATCPASRSRSCRRSRTPASK